MALAALNRPLTLKTQGCHQQRAACIPAGAKWVHSACFERQLSWPCQPSPKLQRKMSQVLGALEGRGSCRAGGRQERGTYYLGADIQRRGPSSPSCLGGSGQLSSQRLQCPCPTVRPETTTGEQAPLPISSQGGLVGGSLCALGTGSVRRSSVEGGEAVPTAGKEWGHKPRGGTGRPTSTQSCPMLILSTSIPQPRPQVLHSRASLSWE